MTWHKPLPPVLPSPEPAAGQGQEEHFLLKPLTFPKPFFGPPTPFHSVQRKKWPKALMAADLDAGSHGPVCQSFVLYIYSSGRQVTEHKEGVLVEIFFLTFSPQLVPHPRNEWTEGHQARESKWL